MSAILMPYCGSVHPVYVLLQALTLIHTVTTLLGMQLAAALGMFEVKRLSRRRIAPLAAAYVAYVVLCNLNLQQNTVSFYQIR